MATASCFVVMPQVTEDASAHTGGKAARTHDHTTPHRDHDGREGRDHQGGRADLVVSTKGPRGTIVPGRTYEWPFEVTNRGTVPAKDVALTARPDRNLKVLAIPSKCHRRKFGPLVCKIGLLPQGQTRRGTITATLAPRVHRGKALSNPVQVSWSNAPRSEQRLAAFPPVEVSPADGTADPESTGEERIPYPLMVTEHGPVTSESVVVRSPIGIPAPGGPCANGLLSKIAGKAVAIKPALGSCGAKQDDPTACGCTGTHHASDADQPSGAYVPDRNAVTSDRPTATTGRSGEPATDRPATDRPATTPCGAVAARPVILPAPAVEHATSPCAGAQGQPGACGCLNAQHAPVSAAEEPLTPATSQVPTVSGQNSAPCAAEDKPMADGKATTERPAGTNCGAKGDAPAAVREQPANTPDTIAPMTPLAGQGKSALPLGRPHHHFPRASGRAHRDCVRQGSGLVCPLGSAPRHRPNVVNLRSPSHPHALHCVGSVGAGCHTREARPVAVRPQPVRGNLPTTGGPAGLLALSGFGLVGAGAVLYRLSRTRRRSEES